MFVDSNRDNWCREFLNDYTLEEQIEQEIGKVREESLKQIFKLQAVPDIHRGVQCFVLFLLDLLGVSSQALLMRSSLIVQYVER